MSKPKFTPPKPPRYRGRMKRGVVKCPRCKWRVPDTWYCLNCGKILKAVRTVADYDRLDMSKSERKRKHRKKKLEKKNESKR